MKYCRDCCKEKGCWDAKGVTFNKVGGALYLSSLTDAKGVTFNKVGGALDLRSLSQKERDIVRKKCGK